MDIKKELEKRILIIDGAMGTMIQQHKLQEADYRGERFTCRSALEEPVIVGVLVSRLEHVVIDI